MDKYFLTAPSVKISYAIHGSNEKLKATVSLNLNKIKIEKLVGTWTKQDFNLDTIPLNNQFLA